MSKVRSWTDDQLRAAIRVSISYRNVLKILGLVPAGGNYEHVQHRVADLKIDTSHFTGKGWNVGLKFNPNNPTPIGLLLIKDGRHQSFSLKKRLFAEGIKMPKCELCGWAEMSDDGRIPVELDHINGDHHDNRLENLRVLCPNCHSLQATHRGRNKKVRLRAGAGTGIQG